MGPEGGGCGSALSRTDYRKDNDTLEAIGNQVERFSLTAGCGGVLSRRVI